MYNENIIYYSKNPFNKFKMNDFSVSYFESNETCWDALEIFLKIEDNIIKDWSFYGDTAIITTACSSILWESIIWINIYEVLKMDYNNIVELIWDEISEKRKKASVLGLLTTRNAIHKFLNDWLKDDFIDLIK